MRMDETRRETKEGEKGKVRRMRMDETNEEASENEEKV